jgi:hypothetical protein
MRPSRQRGWTSIAIAISFVLAPALPAAAAGASQFDASGAPERLLAVNTRAPAPALSLEGLPTVQAQAGGLVNVEGNPLSAKIEAAGLPTIETPSLPRVEGPSTPPVESPAPVEAPPLPTAGTPAPTPAPTGSTTSPAAPTPSSSASGARAASTSAANASGGPTQAGADGGSTAPTAAPRGRPARSAASRRRGRGAAKPHVPAAPPAAGLASTGAASAAAAISSPAALARSSAAHGAPSKSASNGPLETIGRQIPFPVPVPDWSKPIILALLLLAILFAVRSRLATLRARRLEGQRATMLSDLGLMQAALVPAIPQRLGGLSVSVAYEPADGPAAGGDFYDLFEVGPGRVAIVVGDVVGHGRPALTQAALTRYTLRAYLQAGLEPRAALALASSVLASPGEKQFATVVAAIHDSAAGRVTYACAGHPPPIAIGVDLREPIAVCCSPPICCDLPTGQRQTIVSLPAEGQLCFFSDGLLEARLGDDLLGRERLSEIAGELGLSATAPALLARVRSAASATPDDMVACLVSPAPGVSGEIGEAGALPAVICEVEELELSPEMLEQQRVHRFLDACRLDGASIGALLDQARQIAGRQGSALLRIERPRCGRTTAAVSAGRSLPDAGPRASAPAPAPNGSARPALALSTAAMSTAPQ